MNVSLDQAVAVIRTSLEAARKAGMTAAVCVVDSGGHPVAFQRMDGTPFGAAKFAERKAMSSAALGAPTSALAKGLLALPGLLSAAQDGIAFVEGGLPIRLSGELLGGVGVAGGTGGQDESFARAGLAALMSGA